MCLSVGWYTTASQAPRSPPHVAELSCKHRRWHAVSVYFGFGYGERTYFGVSMFSRNDNRRHHTDVVYFLSAPSTQRWWRRHLCRLPLWSSLKLFFKPTANSQTVEQQQPFRSNGGNVHRWASPCRQSYQTAEPQDQSDADNIQAKCRLKEQRVPLVVMLQPASPPHFPPYRLSKQISAAPVTCPNNSLTRHFPPRSSLAWTCSHSNRQLTTGATTSDENSVVSDFFCCCF